MTPENYIKAQLLGLAHREARHCGGVDNMRAVAFVMRNRVLAGWHGGDWMAVLEQHETIRADAGFVRPLPMDYLRSIEMRMMLQEIDDIFSGAKNDVWTGAPDTGYAKHFAVLADVTNPWFRENVLRQPEEHPRIAVVGPMSFFL